MSPDAVRPTHPEKRPRRIGLHHIAFLRGYFEGIDLATLAEQYLDFGRDRQRAQAARRWIVEELVAAARKQREGAGVRLLRLPAGALPVPSTTNTLPTLESFRQEVDPDGVYSESELVELFQDLSQQSDPTNTRRAARNARLRSRQRALLDQLEASLAEPPRLVHALGDWLEPAIADRLERVGLSTLAELLTYINQHGYRWYKRVPRVGAISAQRIVHWVERNADGLGTALEASAQLPRSQWTATIHSRYRRRQTGIAPIEYFDHPDPAVQADRDALLACLQPYRAKPSTYRAYRVQAERALLWSVHVGNLRLADWRASDVEAFSAFLTQPAPTQHWTGAKAERGTTAWRPFEGAPSSHSLAVGRRILKRLFDHLVASKHIEQNPFIAAKRPLAAATSSEKARRQKRTPHLIPIAAADSPSIHSPSTAAPAAQSSAHAAAQIVLDKDAWSALLDHIDATQTRTATRTDDMHAMRMRVVIGAMADAGCRLSALLSATLHTFNTTEAPSADDGLPGRLTPATLRAIDRYLASRGIDRHDARHAPLLLLGHHDDEGPDAHRRPLTANVVARAVKRHLNQLSRSAEAKRLGLDMPLRTASARTLQRFNRQHGTPREHFPITPP